MKKIRKSLGVLAVALSLLAAAPAFADTLVTVVYHVDGGRTEIWVDGSGSQYYIYYDGSGRQIGVPPKKEY